jgi:hypothetical protein
MFIYIGARGHFNSYINTSKMNNEVSSGSSDVRVEYSNEWSDTESLKWSRKMAAAGGAEWCNATSV